MKIQSIKGTKDILPDETAIFLKAEQALRATMAKYGYREIRTPLFEQTELFIKGTGETTDIVNKEMYSFTDNGGRHLSLRPEGTPSIVRTYLENNLHKKRLFQKLFYYGRMYRQESPQAGRLREFRQFGIEAIGSGSPQIDAEVILLGVDALQAIGLSVIDLQINSVGCDECRPQYKQALKTFIAPKLDGMCDDCQRRYETNILRMLDCKQDACKKALRDAPTHLDFLCRACKQHFADVQQLLSDAGCTFALNPYLVRGLDYYTKTVFEFISPKLGAQDAVGGGGRYDGMVELFGGPSIPAIGFACGMERILLAVSKEGQQEEIKPSLDCYLVSMDKETDRKAFELLVALRRRGIRCEKDYLSRSIKAQMKDANRAGARYAIIIGPEEVEARQVTLRKMSDSMQQRLPDTPEQIASVIGSDQA